MFYSFQKECPGEAARPRSSLTHIPTVLDDIFGKHDGNLKIEGLVDCTSAEDFQQKLEALEEHWYM